MASGPGRARAAKEELFQELGYTDSEAFWGFFVLETDRAPPDELIARVAADCGLAPAALTFILTPTTSLAGAVQITARVLEVACTRCTRWASRWRGCATAWAPRPLPPPSPDFLTAMGRTNDAILFGGEVQLFVDRAGGRGARAGRRSCRAPPRATTASRSRGSSRTPGTTSTRSTRCCSARRGCMVTCLDSGRTFAAGRLAPDLLAQSFGDGAA